MVVPANLGTEVLPGSRGHIVPAQSNAFMATEMPDYEFVPYSVRRPYLPRHAPGSW